MADSSCDACSFAAALGVWRFECTVVHSPQFWPLVDWLFSIVHPMTLWLTPPVVLFSKSPTLCGHFIDLSYRTSLHATHSDPSQRPFHHILSIQAFSLLLERARLYDNALIARSMSTLLQSFGIAPEAYYKSHEC